MIFDFTLILFFSNETTLAAVSSQEVSMAKIFIKIRLQLINVGSILIVRILLSFCNSPMVDEQNENCGENMDDNDIIALVQDGKTECFDIIIDRYEQKLFYYVMRFVNNADEARDLVQIVFIKTLKHIDSFDCDKKFSSWIYRIAHNEAMNYLTRNQHRKCMSIDDEKTKMDCTDIAGAENTALDDWFQIELRDELHSAVEQLPEQYAQVIQLHYFEDKSYKEISEIINKPTSSVGTLLRRAKKRLLLIVIESEKF